LTVPAHKSLLLRAEVRPAGKLCYCKHNKKHAITKGEPRLAVKEAGPAAAERGYCAACAREMLDEADAKLAALRKALG
jgi:hypothetical protein